VLHSLVNDGEPRGLMFVCLTDEKFPQPLAFAFLAAVRNAFLLCYTLPVMMVDKNLMLRFELNDFSQRIRPLVKKFRISKMSKRLREEDNSNEPLEPVGTLKLDEMYPGMLKKPLMVRHLEDPSVLLHATARKSSNFFLSQFLIRHPFLTIGLFIFVASITFLYFVVIIPLCGKDLQRIGYNGKRVCWIN